MRACMVSDDVPRLNPSDFLKLFTAAFSVFGILHFLGFPEHVGSNMAWAWNVSSPSSSTTSATSMERRRAIVMMSFHSSEPQNVDFASFKHFPHSSVGHYEWATRQRGAILVSLPVDTTG